MAVDEDAFIHLRPNGNSKTTVDAYILYPDEENPSAGAARRNARKEGQCQLKHSAAWNPVHIGEGVLRRVPSGNRFPVFGDGRIVFNRAVILVSKDHEFMARVTVSARGTMTCREIRIAVGSQAEFCSCLTGHDTGDLAGAPKQEMGAHGRGTDRNN